MRRAAAWLRDAGERGTPVLGVCFGHQLLAYAYGARVEKNPRGREIGTVDVAVTREDPLFDGLPPTLTVQTTHEDIVPEAPREATVLAGNDFCAVQAFAVGKNIRAVQFHPEIQPGTMAAMIRARADKLKDPERLLAGVRPTPHGQRILRNFLSRFG
jgi:GMP synthase (glutamine-hydrolysing)